jgi:UDP-arabinose 4-epimerase
MNILITGGAGYIGSHTCKAFAQYGHLPVTIDDLSTGHAHNVRWGPFVQANICDTTRVKKVFKDYKIDAVVHFAGSALVGESLTRPLAYFQNNVGATLSLLDAMQQSGVNEIVFSSTCATYGLPVGELIQEEQRQEPINPYGDSKLSVERVLDWMGAAGQLHWAALRYFNAAGADREGELGEEHDHETHLLPLAIQAALRQREHLQIFGTDYPTPDGTAIRDYIHVSDLASAHLCALSYLERGGQSGAFNLGTGRGHSVLEVIGVVESVSGRSVPKVIAPRRSGDPPILVASAQRAREILQWEPTYSDLRLIIESAWRWHSRAQSQAELHSSVTNALF